MGLNFMIRRMRKRAASKPVVQFGAGRCWALLARRASRSKTWPRSMRLAVHVTFAECEMRVTKQPPLLDRNNIPLRFDAQPHRGRTILVGTGFRFKMSVVPASPRLDE